MQLLTAPTWYEASVPPRVPAPPFAGDRQAEVCVIGGGFTGLSAALDLAMRGVDTVLVEGGRVGSGASGRNGGQLATAFNPNPSDIAQLVGAEAAQALMGMAGEAMRLLEERIARHGIECHLVRGYLYVGEKRRHLRELADMEADWRAHGYAAARLIDAAETRRWVDSPRYVGGLIDPGGGHLHPLALVHGLAGAAEAAGARLHEETRVVSVDHETAVVETRSALGTGRIRAERLVLAGNAHIGRLAGPAADRLMPVVSLVAATAPLGHDLARQILPRDVAVCDFNFVLNYFRRTHDDRLLFGGGVSYSGQVGGAAARALVRSMRRYFPQLKGVPVDYLWGGRIAITRNRLPAFGRIGRAVHAHGFSGHGVALSGLAGRLMADAITGPGRGFDLFARIPHERFPGGPRLRLPLLVAAMTWYRLRDLLS